LEQTQGVENVSRNRYFERTIPEALWRSLWMKTLLLTGAPSD
jgi:hypothetical protein